MEASPTRIRPAHHTSDTSEASLSPDLVFSDRSPWLLILIGPGAIAAFYFDRALLPPQMRDSHTNRMRRQR